MPNRDPWMNHQQSEEEFNTSRDFEKQLLSIKDERQEMIHPKSHPTYNERHQKIIELIDWTLEKYRTNRETQQNEQTIIDNIIDELIKKREISIHKKKKAQLKDDVAIYRLEEATIDYVLFRIRELTGRLI